MAHLRALLVAGEGWGGPGIFVGFDVILAFMMGQIHFTRWLPSSNQGRCLLRRLRLISQRPLTLNYFHWEPVRIAALLTILVRTWL